MRDFELEIKLQEWLDLVASIEWPEGMPDEVHKAIADKMAETTLILKARSNPQIFCGQ